MDANPAELIDATAAAELATRMAGRRITPRHIRRWADDGLLPVSRMPGARPLYGKAAVAELVGRLAGRATPTN
jgi:hypothetical protein